MITNDSNNEELQESVVYKTYEQLIKSDLFIKRNIYLDFKLIKHLPSSYLWIHYLDNDEKFKLFLNTISSDTFKNRVTDLLDIIFPDLVKNEIDIEDIYSYFLNKELFKFLSILPNTQHIYFIINIINTIKSNLIVTEKHYSNMNLVVNIYPFISQYTIYLEELFLNIFSIKTKVISQPIKNLGNIFNNYDLILLYDVEDILKTKILDTYTNESDILNLSNVMLIGTKITNKRNILKEKSIEEIKNDFNFVTNYLNGLLDFGYLDPSLIINEYQKEST